MLVTEPPAVVNTTSTAPATCNGVTTVTVVAFTFVSDVPTVPSKVTDVVADKLVPVIVTVVPPAVGPADGETLEIVGAATKVKPPVAVADPPAVVNTTSTAAAAFAGVTTVTVVAFTFVNDVPAVPPNVMLVVSDKFVPVIVTVVLPAVGPLDGETVVMVGIPANV